MVLVRSKFSRFVTAKNKTNRAWVQRHITDPYVRQAQQRGYRSRAAFKLLEIDEKDRLLRPGQFIIDLGSAPGSWSQVLRERVSGQASRILAIDLLPMDPVAGIEFLQGDFQEPDVLAQIDQWLNGRRVDLVLSDMAPNLSGVGVADAARVMHLGELALEFAAQQLKPNGALLVKTFQGSGFSQLVEAFKKVFQKVNQRKPSASRAESSELFLLGRDLKIQSKTDETKA